MLDDRYAVSEEGASGRMCVMAVVHKEGPEGKIVQYCNEGCRRKCTQQRQEIRRENAREYRWKEAGDKRYRLVLAEQEECGECLSIVEKRWYGAKEEVRL